MTELLGETSFTVHVYPISPNNLASYLNLNVVAAL